MSVDARSEQGWATAGQITKAVDRVVADITGGGLQVEVQSRRRLPSPALQRELCRDAGVTQFRLAKELGVAPITVSRWQSGQRTPRGELLVAYVRLLDQIATPTDSQRLRRIPADSG